MKYRPLLKEDLKNIDIASETIDKKKNNWQTQTYKIKVITPIYGGGVNAGEPDKDMPIRASAIRGQLRYWWRFLYINDPVNKADKIKDEDLFYKNLFIKEREIWGGMGDEKELKDSAEKDFSSKVIIRIKNIENFDKKRDVKLCGSYKKKVNRETGNVSYPFYFNYSIPPYSLFCAQGKSPKPGSDGKPEENPHQIIRAGLAFELTISFPENIKREQIEESVKWWVCFGGIGARTRRGLGSIYSNDIEVLNAKDVKKYGCILKEINATNETDAWNTAIKKLQEFRQNPVGRNGMGRSKWPEPDSIRDITTNELRHAWQHQINHKSIRSFPRAAFGLPIIFEIRGSNEPPKTQLEPVIRNIEAPRMASTVILKALKTKEGYKAIALRLPITHLNDLTVKLDYINLGKEVNNNELKKELAECLPLEFDRSDDSHWWPISLEEQEAKAEHIPPMKKYKATNTLDAFMTFFEEGGQ